MSLFFSCSGDHRDLHVLTHSFPTRRSSDLLRKAGVQPVVLFVARDPAEVAASIEARNGWAPALSGIAWLRHMLEAETASRDLPRTAIRSEEHTSELQSLMRISYAVFCLKKKNRHIKTHSTSNTVISH